mgnify:CR=1 FL=1
MIEGLKVTVNGVELRSLCMDRAGHHRERARAYQEQIESMGDLDLAVGAGKFSNGDPRDDLKEQKTGHDASAAEMAFIAEHLIEDEKYLLDRADLAKLGICKRAY